MIYGDRAVLSRPARVLWAGWQTTTYDLQRAGWGLSAYEFPMDDRVGLAMINEEMGMRMISASADFNYHAHWSGKSDGAMPTFVVDNCVGLIGGRMVHIERIDGELLSAFRPIDAKTMWIKREAIEDLEIFATRTTQGIIVDPNDVEALMKRIITLDQSKLAEVRERNRNRERRAVGDKLQLHAQILTLAA